MSDTVRIVLPSELVDRVIEASDKLSAIAKDLENVLQGMSRESPVYKSMRALSRNFDNALLHVNNSLDGNLIDLPAYLQVKSKAEELRSLVLNAKLRKFETNRSDGSASSLTSASSNDVLVGFEGEDSGSSGSEDSEVTSDQNSEHASRIEDIYARSFPLFNGTPSKASKILKVVTPATNHEMLDLTGRRLRVIPYTKPGTVTDVYVLESSDEEIEDDEIEFTAGEMTSSGDTPASRVKSVRLTFHSERENQRRRSFRLNNSSSSSSDN